MIKVYKYGEVSNEEIFARVEPKMNVKHEIRKIWVVDIYFDMDYTLFYRIWLME